MSSTLDEAVSARLAALEKDHIVERIWDHDRSVWSDDPNAQEIVDRLGWLDLPSSMASHIPRLQSLAADVAANFDRMVLLGMGGASLAPEVLVRSVARPNGHPSFRMLDSTHPWAVADIERSHDLDSTLFIVASKSGTTLETMSFLRYFWDRTGGKGEQFIAITDTGTPLEALALERRFRQVILNPTDIGGRFSALSFFGLVPAALAGVDTERVRVRAETMAKACRARVTENPGALLGAWMAEAALAGRDKLLVHAAEPVSSFGLWADQLVAESTGKDGKGILPVTDWDGQALADDQIGISIGGSGTPDSGLTRSVALSDAHDLGREFFRWEFATAIAGAVLGVNPFDQPNVAESKQKTLAVLDAVVARDDPRRTRKSVMHRFVDAVRPGDYIAISAWVPPTEERDATLGELRRILSERCGVSVTVAYGPRLLHSSGQLHKGGPAKGHFVQLVDPDPRDVPVPGMPYSFGDLLAAQALGDYEALAGRGRPVLQISDIAGFLETI